MITEAFEQLEQVLDVKNACELTGIARATLYRRRNPKPRLDRPPALRPAPPNALSPAERHEVLERLNSYRFADKAPAQVWATLLDEGVYLCSISTMYRLLRVEDGVRERRAQARHPSRTIPELVADGPGQVFTWDITKLKGPRPGITYDLYVMIDIYSRYVVGWRVEHRESAELAADFIATTVARNGGRPHVVHADRGTSMTSGDVAALLAELQITRSHSRPKVSNDNPYSEAAFKTLKYCPAFPERFGGLADAHVFCEAFFAYYNHEHRHSGIGLHTPASVHFGTAAEIREQRAATLQAAYAANPGRFRKKPAPPTIPAKAWINDPDKREKQVQNN
ncbi:IS3 family transposase [Nonomuraea sp. NPDC046570]|uniref:IS3 family transposase n=1 Tax=Nonomuraea sp. NPDC046570 TaxID=3155255 RepID=UPI0033C61476